MKTLLRASRASDFNFIVSSWRDTYVESALAHSMSPSLYRRRWSRLARRMVETLPAVVLVDETAPDIILGWLVHEARTLHYLFVREDFRKLGYARRLLTGVAGLATYSARTSAWQLLGPKLAPRLQYDPAQCWRHFASTDLS